LNCAGRLHTSQVLSGIAVQVAQSLRNRNRELNASIREWDFPDTKLEQAFPLQSAPLSLAGPVAATPSKIVMN
jgi:hypothetical protein